ncbi:hypothetical protein [Cupriavidus sp. AcVe19-1a]|uniref:hypothetical protein n=1 Tax=Cupriavidus sp. AcVe19-1a TaxID=2821359 RepID=UPI001AE34C86|nr:hypothetical protein [Cupriavidus sp. AcVe19-1a]MBP0627730.1 hypothetical protein [Cupriavidus sp. AcVe19-1a]
MNAPHVIVVLLNPGRYGLRLEADGRVHWDAEDIPPEGVAATAEMMGHALREAGQPLAALRVLPPPEMTTEDAMDLARTIGDAIARGFSQAS